MAVYLEIAAHSAYDMFSKYKYLIVNLVFPPWFLEWEFLSVAPFPGHYILVPFYLLYFTSEILFIFSRSDIRNILTSHMYETYELDKCICLYSDKMIIINI